MTSYDTDPSLGLSKAAATRASLRQESRNQYMFYPNQDDLYSPANIIAIRNDVVTLEDILETEVNRR